MAGWNNTVPQGVMGTGNAQVFDVNPVAGQFGSQLQNLRRQQEIRAQQHARAWRENQLETSAGRLWATDMAGIEKSFIDRGIELQQKGVDPYGSSKEAMEYQRDKRYVEAKQGFRKSTEERVNEMLKLVNTNPDKYSPEKIREINEYISNTKLDDAFEKNIAPPQLEERFDVNDHLKTIKAIVKEDKYTDKEKGLTIEERAVDEPATQNIILGALTRDPRGAKYAQELTSGFDVPTVREFAPTYKDNVKLVSDYIKGDPQERKRLAAQGILPGTPMMEEYVSDLAQTHTEARKKFDSGMKDLVSASTSGLTLGRKEDPFKEDLSRERLDEQKRHNRVMENRPTGGSGDGEKEYEAPSDVPLHYGTGGKAVTTGRGVVKIHIPEKNFVGATAIDLHNGQPTDITESSNDYEVVSVGNYPILTKDITIQKKNKDGKVISSKTLKKGSLVQDSYAEKYPQNIQEEPRIHVQEKVGTSGVRNRLVDYSYMPKGLTKAQNEALGQFKPAAQSKTTGGKKSATVSQIKALVGKKGYEGYTEKELIEHYKSHGYDIK